MNKKEYLERYIFIGLRDQNSGFDVSTIKYFSQDEFEIILSRIERYGLGITGIEPWFDGEFHGVAIYEDYTSDPTDPTWYNTAFKEFVDSGKALQYSATYKVPDRLLK